MPPGRWACDLAAHDPYYTRLNAHVKRFFWCCGKKIFYKDSAPVAVDAPQPGGRLRNGAFALGAGNHPLSLDKKK